MIDIINKPEIRIENRTFNLQEGVTVVGRGNTADIIIESSKLSRTHARFTYKTGSLVVEDLDSRNGTFVNGKRIEQACRLKEGDEITFGDLGCSLVFNSTPQKNKPGTGKSKQNRKRQGKRTGAFPFHFVILAGLIPVILWGISTFTGGVTQEQQKVRKLLVEVERVLNESVLNGDVGEIAGRREKLSEIEARLGSVSPEYSKEYKTSQTYLKTIRTESVRLDQLLSDMNKRKATAAAFDVLEKDLASSGGDIETGIRTCRLFINMHPNTPEAGKALTRIEELENLLRKKEIEELSLAEGKIRELILNGEYGSALEQLNRAEMKIYKFVSEERLNRLSDLRTSAQKGAEELFVKKVKRIVSDAETGSCEDALEKLKSEYDRLNSENQLGIYMKASGDIQRISEKKVKLERDKIAEELELISELEKTRLYEEAGKRLESVRRRITQKNLKQEIQKRISLNKLYLTVKTNIIRLIADEKEVTVDKLGTISRVTEDSLEMIVDGNTMNIKWELIKDKEFILLAGKSADSYGGGLLTLAYAFLLEKNGDNKLADEWYFKVVSADETKEYDYLILAARKRAEQRKSELLAKQELRKKEREKKAALTAAVPAEGKTAEVLRKLGKSHFMLGVTSSPADTWVVDTREQGCQWDMRYQYLAAGVNGNSTWRKWNSPDGAFVTRYITQSKTMGIIPVFSWYQSYQTAVNAGIGGGEDGGNKGVLERTDLMTLYLNDVKFFMELAGKFKDTPIIFHFEPDLFGYVMISPKFGSTDPDKILVQVSSTGIEELKDLPNTATGFAQSIAKFRDLYAPNVLLGWHPSGWGNPDMSIFSNFINKSGGWDIIFVDPSDRDAGWKIAHNYHIHNLYWDDAKAAHFRNSASKMHKETGLPVIAWQIPMGNKIKATCNNTEFHYMDNRAEYYLENYPQNTNIKEWAEAGFIALLFGGGARGCTSTRDVTKDGVTNPEPVEGNKGEKAVYPDDDGGYLRERGAQYYKKGPVPLRVN